MNRKDIDFRYILQYAVTILIGYLAVSVFLASFIVASHANELFGLSVPLSEASTFAIAIIFVSPLLIPFIWRRLNKLKIGELEINLTDVSTRVKLSLADELREVEQLAMGPSQLPNLIEKLAQAISEAERSKIVEIEFGNGKPPWWSTRLYLLAALAEKYTNIQQMIFLEYQPGRDRVYMGSATPARLRQALAAVDPALQQAWEAAMKEDIPDYDAETPEKRIAWIAHIYVRQFNAQGGEEKVKEVVTGEFLHRCEVVTGNSIDWEGGPPKTWLIHDILEHSEPYVVLVKADGRLNLIVDRMKLAEHIAKKIIRNQLE